MTLTNREYRVIRIVDTERIMMGWMVILGLQARWLLGRIATLDSLPAAPAWALRAAPVDSTAAARGRHATGGSVELAASGAMTTDDGRLGRSDGRSMPPPPLASGWAVSGSSGQACFG